MDVLTGTYKNGFYFNTKNGQQAFMLKPQKGVCDDKLDCNGEVKAVGRYCLRQKKMPLYLAGKWKQTEDKWEFHFREVSEYCQFKDEATDLIEQIKVDHNLSITQKYVQRITSKVGTDLFSAISISGIEDEIAEDDPVASSVISQVFSKLRSLVTELKLFKMLDGYGGTYEDTAKILRKFPDDAMTVLVQDSYRIYEEANVAFELIDKIALANGVEPLSEVRIKAILLWCIRRETNSGNVYMTFEDLCNSASKAYGDIPNTAIAGALEDHPFIVRDNENNIFYEKRMLVDEKLAAKEFVRLMKSSKELPFHPEYIELIEKENGRKFGNQQKEAFMLLQSTGVKLLTGDPGTGKTTTVNGLLRYLELLWEKEFKRKPKFALCAPSGRASQRMKETTKRNALTVHKLLEYQPYGAGEYYKNSDDPIDADVIVVDEMSMLGLSTYSKLEGAIKSGALILLVGDTNQIQSVEPGNVLADIIASGCVDSCHLTEVFRQAEESLININAKKIISGDGELREGPDFSLVQSTPDKTPELLLETVSALIAEAGDAKKVQVLAPVKKGTCGVFAGNNLLQDLFNPGKDLIWHGAKKFRLNDRVILMTNNYALNYFNGDVGYIKRVSESGIKIEIGDELISLPLTEKVRHKS